MQTFNEYQLKIYSDGMIEVAKDTVYVKEEGNELARERYRQVLEPGQFEEAEKLLPIDKMAIIEATWSDEVVDTYRAKLLAKQDLEK